jgi:hypothetical protein
MACKIPECKSKATYGFTFANPEYCMKHGRENGAKTQFGICCCGKSTPRFALHNDKASCCAKCKSDNMINISDRRCFCKKHLPTYGLPEGKRPEYCSECKKADMINLKDKNHRCLCNKAISSFGMKGGKPTCCIKCKDANMVNLITIQCPCGKSAVFGFKGDKKPSFCMKCKKEGMENIVTKKCKCGKAVPVFGLKGSKKPKCCMSCKTEEMINIAHKLCNCKKAQPIFGLKTDTVPTCCVSCKTENMIDILGKKCPCGKQPVFGKKGDKKATCCAKCKTTEMVNIKAKMCRCGKSQPVFGLRTDKKATCCVICKNEDMIDIMSKKCRGLVNYQGKGDLDCPYDNRCKEKYSNYCTKCFEKNFPDDPRTDLIRKNTHEDTIKRYLFTEFSQFIHNTTIWTGQSDCTCRRRIDFRWLIGNTLLCIEVDEEQHKYREKEDELMRYDDLMMLHGGKFLFIRFNPDMYKDDEGNRKNPEMATRLRLLKTTILESIEEIQNEENEELVEVKLLFFDEMSS